MALCYDDQRRTHFQKVLDTLYGGRETSAIQQHGRWEAPESVKRYEHGSRLPEMLSMLGDRQRVLAGDLLRDLSWLHRA